MARVLRLFFFLLLSAALVPPPAAVAAAEPPKVSLALYYESLCPYCSRFIVNHLAGIFEDGLIDVVDLLLVPYGNAHVRGANNTINCQHGPYECLLNNVEACAIDAWPDLNVHFGFINCVEELVVNGKCEEWESCFQKQNLDSKPVMECYNSEHGQKLSLEYGKQTDALVPPHKYVPWVVVDGQPLYDDYENFESFVCKAYKGHPPKACQELSRRNPIVQQVVKAGNGVSYNSVDVELDGSVDSKIKMDYEDDFESFVCKAYKGHPPKACQELSRRYPIVQQVVKAGNGVSYNSVDVELDDSVDSKIKMVLAGDAN